MIRDHRASQTAPPQQPPHELLPTFLHDLNNLLGIVMGNAELLLDRGDLDAKCAKRLESIHNASMKARDLTAGLQNKLP